MNTAKLTCQSKTRDDRPCSRTSIREVRITPHRKLHLCAIHEETFMEWATTVGLVAALIRVEHGRGGLTTQMPTARMTGSSLPTHAGFVND